MTNAVSVTLAFALVVTYAATHVCGSVVDGRDAETVALVTSPVIS